VELGRLGLDVCRLKRTVGRVRSSRRNDDAPKVDPGVGTVCTRKAAKLLDQSLQGSRFRLEIEPDPSKPVDNDRALRVARAHRIVHGGIRSVSMTCWGRFGNGAVARRRVWRGFTVGSVPARQVSVTAVMVKVALIDNLHAYSLGGGGGLKIGGITSVRLRVVRGPLGTRVG
jgi:hypothetical protein